MSTLLARERLEAEVFSLERLLANTPASDLLGRLALQEQLDTAQAELAQIRGERATRAQIALVFDGGPVKGSSAIEVPFGTRAIDAFQRAVTTTYALHAAPGQVGERGPTLNAEKSALHITGLVHGSFGFVLEEIDPEGEQWIDSALKMAVDEVSSIISQIATEDEDNAVDAFAEADARQISNLREFVKLINDNEATLRMSRSDADFSLDRNQVRRAYERISDIDVTDEMLSLDGVLQGILPDARKFELATPAALIKGSIARGISEDYLRHLEVEPLVGEVTAVLRRRVIKGRLRATRESYVLTTIIKDGIAHPPIV